VGSFLSVTLAWGQQTPPPAKSAAPAQMPPPKTEPSKTTQPALPVKADPKANEALTKAIDQLGPKKVEWIETTFWQELNNFGLTLTANGAYLLGPDHRVRLDLKTTVGGVPAETLTVCDGTTIWNAIKVGKGERAATKWDLKQVQSVLKTPGTLPQFAEDFYRSQAFNGLEPVLQHLRQQMTFTKLENADWHNHKVLKLTAVWASDMAKALSLPNNGWQPTMPRTLRLFLDKDSYWPYRLEWWGPLAPQGEDVLLLQQEYRDPHLVPAGQKPPERLAQAFTFDSANTKVIDGTKDLTERLTAQIRNQQTGSRGTPPATTPR
jgi:hypothetical protein